MKAICPTCGISSLLIIRDEKAHALYNFDDDSRKYRATIANCANPDCNEIILLWQRIGFETVQKTYEAYEEFHSWEEDEIRILSQEILLPKISSFSRQVAKEVPELYKNDFLEACNVLPISPKSSAAISRRLLQNILREHFKIVRPDLFHEIDEFIKTQNAPSLLNKEIDAIRKIGNFAAHPLKSTSTGLIVDVEPGEAEWLIEVLEDLFDFAFVKPKESEEKLKRLDAKLQDIGKPPKKKS
jgi:hypothetical protein